MLTPNARIIDEQLAEECAEELVGTWESLEWALEQCGEDPDEYDIDASWQEGALADLSECMECSEWHYDWDLNEDQLCEECEEGAE